MRHDDLPNQSSMFSREDMGAMMDLKLETVSREVSGLVREQVIKPLDKSGRLYRIQNEQALQSAWLQEWSGFGCWSRQKQPQKKHPHAYHEHDADEAHEAVVCEKQVV